MDLVALGSLPLVITITLAEATRIGPVQRAMREWAKGSADLETLPVALASLPVPMESVTIAPGGRTAGALRAARRWGCRAALGGVLGRDSAGEFIERADTEAGIDLGLVRWEADRATPIHLVLNRREKVSTEALTTEDPQVSSLFQSSREEWAACQRQLEKLAPRALHLDTVNRKVIDLADRLPQGTRYSLSLSRLPDRTASAFQIEQFLKRAHLLVISHECVEDWLAYFAPLDLPEEGHRPEGVVLARSAALLAVLFSLSPALEMGIVTRAAQGTVVQTRDGVPSAMPAFGSTVPAGSVGGEETLTGTLLAGLLANGWGAGGTAEEIDSMLMRSLVAAELQSQRHGRSAEVPSPEEVESRLAQAPGRWARREWEPAGPAGHFSCPRGFQTASTSLGRLSAGILSAVQRTSGGSDLSRLRVDFEETKTLVAIGSGSSFSVACAVARLARRLLPVPYTAEAYRPGEYLALGRPGETVLCITQSGNPDIETATEHARRLGLAPFLITARKGRWTESFPESHVLHHAGESVRSYVNVRGPCAAVALITEWLMQQAGQPIPSFEKYAGRYDQACKQVEQLRQEGLDPVRSFVALASGLMLAPLHELDLKAAESGIALESYELKGWTHGRYQRVWKSHQERQQAFITLETPRDARVVAEMAKRFVGGLGARPIPFYRLCATDDTLGLWQHFVHVMLLTDRLAPTDPTALVVPSPLEGINRRITLGLPAGIEGPGMARSDQA